MGTDYEFTHVIKTTAPLVVVMEAVMDALSPLGGRVSSNHEKGIISIEDGKVGIFGDFLFDCSARLVIQPKGEGKYTIWCTIDKSPNYIFWLMLIGGFCTGVWFIWGLNLYYLFIDLAKEYQRKLDKVEAHL